MCDSLSLSRPARRARANREAAPPRPLCARFSPRLRRNGRPRANPPWLAESRTETTAPRLRLASATQARTSKIGCTPSKDQTTTMSADELREKTGPYGARQRLTPKRSIGCPAPRRARVDARGAPTSRPLLRRGGGRCPRGSTALRRRACARAPYRDASTRVPSAPSTRRVLPPRHRRGRHRRAVVTALSAQATSPARASRPACCTTVIN